MNESVRRSAEQAERIREAVLQIGRSAQQSNRARTAELAEALRLARLGHLDEAGRERAVASAHQMVGSAGTFGYPHASELASELEEFFDDADFDDPARLNAARQIVAALQAEFESLPVRRIDLED